MKGKPEKLEELYFLSKPSAEVIQDLVKVVVENCTQKLKIKALLLQTYHHAIHNRYFEAHDLLMKTNLSSQIGKQIIANQIYYNRAIVQIGLSAFR